MALISVLGLQADSYKPFVNVSCVQCAGLMRLLFTLQSLSQRYQRQISSAVRGETLV